MLDLTALPLTDLLKHLDQVTTDMDMSLAQRAEEVARFQGDLAVIKGELLRRKREKIYI